MRIGRYEIIEELGRGAMGVVYKASDPSIGRIVAIKIILTSSLDAAQLADYKRRFFREAQLAGRVSHPGIVTIYDIAEDELGQPYLVMEFVEGVTLQRILRPADDGHLPERLPLDRALDLASQTAEALDFAHRSGVVHNDIKPANVLVTPEGRVKVADFGVAKFTDTDASCTTTVQGTPAYMAPEQLRGGKVDARSDIFSVGAMLYWMVTGQKAFPGEDLASVSFQVVYTDPSKPSEIDPGLPQDIDTVIFRCLAKNRGDRYPSAKSLALDLQSIAAGETISAMPLRVDGETEATITATVPLTLGSFGIPAHGRRASTAERPLNKVLVTAAILVLTLAVVALLVRPVERVLLVSIPSPSVSKAATALPEETSQPLEAPPEALEAAPEAKVAPALVRVAPVISPPRVQSMVVTPVFDSRPLSAAAAAGPPPLESPIVAARPLATETFKPAVERSVAGLKPPVASSTLLFECKHNFRNATLLISSDGKDLDMTVLEKKGIWFASSGGRVENRTPLVLPAGSHQLRVRVKSNDEKKPFDQEAVIEGAFPENGSLRLRIEFPKDQLRLTWAGD